MFKTDKRKILLFCGKTFLFVKTSIINDIIFKKIHKEVILDKIYKKRVLFIGMPDMALVCLSKLVTDGFNIVGVVPPNKEDATYSLMCNFAQSVNLPLITYEKRMDEIDFLHKIRQLNADIAVVASYNKKFPPELLKSVKGGFVNCHPSLLPEYRGANPYSHVIINDEKETGVTLHFMDENFDTGNIILQHKVPLEKNETMGTLFNKMNYICAQAISKFLQQYEMDSNVVSYQQPEGEFKKAPAIEAKNLGNFIDWTKDAAYIQRFVRALNPFISAMTNFRGVFVKVYSAEFSDKKVKEAPGTICHVKDTIGVSTGNGVLYIKTLQFGSYMIADAKEFIEKFKPRVGEKMGA